MGDARQGAWLCGGLRDILDFSDCGLLFDVVIAGVLLLGCARSFDRDLESGLVWHIVIHSLQSLVRILAHSCRLAKLSKPGAPYRTSENEAKRRGRRGRGGRGHTARITGATRLALCTSFVALTCSGTRSVRSSLACQADLQAPASPSPSDYNCGQRRRGAGAVAPACICDASSRRAWSRGDACP